MLPELTDIRIKFLYVQVTLSSGGETTGVARIPPVRIIHRCRFATCRDADYRLIANAMLVYLIRCRFYRKYSWQLTGTAYAETRGTGASCNSSK